MGKSQKQYLISFECYSPKADCQFIVQAAYSQATDFFMVKFYNKPEENKHNKYAIRTTKGDAQSILHTNFGILSYLYMLYPMPRLVLSAKEVFTIQITAIGFYRPPWQITTVIEFTGFSFDNKCGSIGWMPAFR